ncbi:hypothetical protein SAMN04488590_3265 [Microbacterium sp. 77mftsu3.1]|nr:hypothetical protein SAMN04488590_3265 [Microbacterium sp. 77mftsu3.1]
MQSFSSTRQFIAASERLYDWWVNGALGASFLSAGFTLLVLQFDRTAWIPLGLTALALIWLVRALLQRHRNDRALAHVRDGEPLLVVTDELIRVRSSELTWGDIAEVHVIDFRGRKPHPGDALFPPMTFDQVSIDFVDAGRAVWNLQLDAYLPADVATGAITAVARAAEARGIPVVTSRNVAEWKAWARRGN